MKKLLLVVSVCLVGFNLYAGGGRPFLIIHKSNGGWWAWLNLYNEITYTPSLSDSEPARLECSGAGFSACRVSNQILSGAVNPGASLAVGNLLPDAINCLIEKSEESGQRGVLQGADCKKVAVRNATRGGFDTYFVQGTWSYNAYGEGTITIYLNTSDILDRRM